jgi:transcriptional regulator with XRE-family HTH domain
MAFLATTRPLRSFGERVRAHRLQLGLSQETLGDVSKLHRTYVGSLERGERNVCLLNIIRIANALEVDPGDLIRGFALSEMRSKDDNKLSLLEPHFGA